MGEMITGASNPIIKQIRLLRQHKIRRETGLFLVEGIHHVGEAEEAGWKFEVLVHAPDLLSSSYASAIIEKISDKGVRCVAVNGDLFASISEKDNPQGILAVIKKNDQKLAGLVFQPDSLFVALSTPQDPGNIGAILRTIDSSGADGLLLLDGGADLYHPTAVRASMGSIFWVPCVETTFDELLQCVRLNDFFMVGTSAHVQMDYKKISLPKKPVVLLLGSEQKGLTPSQLRDCDIAVSIPMHGRSSSLNLAIAAGILLYSLRGE